MSFDARIRCPALLSLIHLLTALPQLGLRALTFGEALLYLGGDVQRVPASKLRDLRVDSKQLKMLDLSYEVSMRYIY